MPKAKRAKSLPIEVGDEVTVKNWHEELVVVRVLKLIESKEYGAGIHGFELQDGRYASNADFPISRVIHPAKIHNVGFRQWDILFPGGMIERVKGKQAAKDRIISLGYVFGGES